MIRPVFERIGKAANRHNEQAGYRRGRMEWMPEISDDRQKCPSCQRSDQPVANGCRTAATNFHVHQKVSGTGGGPARTRTANPRIRSPMLYPLSYRPVKTCLKPGPQWSIPETLSKALHFAPYSLLTRQTLYPTELRARRRQFHDIRPHAVL